MSESRQCTAIKAGGGRCKNTALPEQEHCYAHSSERAAERKRHAAAGGRSRPKRSADELENIKAQVRGIASGVFQGTIDKGTAAVLGQLYNTLLRSIEIQRKLDHQRDLEEQVEDLRTRIQEVRRQRWGS